MSDNEHNIITIRKHRQLRILELWLGAREYNQVFPFLEDKFGHRMIGLNLKNPDGTYEKRGLVVVPEMDLLDEAIEICEKGKCNGA